MALYPAAVKQLIPPGSNDPRITARVAILHVDAGNAENLHDYFATRSGGIESHFHVTRTGKVYQYRDTAFQADANLDANDFAVSIETQGYGSGEWTPEQITSIKALLLWLHRTHKIPLVQCPTWDGSGIGYHTLFGSPSHWTPVAKSCPGPSRIRQFHDVLVPWMAEQRKPADLRAKSYNMGDASASRVLDDLIEIARTADVICLQEAGDRRGVIDAFLSRHPGWTVDWGTVAGSRSVPILYRRSLDARPFSRLAVPRMFVGPGVGPSWAKSKAITGLHVGKLVVLNTHMVAGAHQADASLLRKAHYRLHMRVLARMAKRRLARGLDVLVLGDFNAAPDHELLQPLRDLGLRQLVTKPTHGTANIYDHVWTNLPGQTVVKAGSSDHRVVGVTLPRRS